MSINFPRLDPNLIITTGVEGPTTIKPVEAIKPDAIQKLIQIGIGKHIQGEVLAKLRDGSFIAHVNGAPMRLALPPETQVGAKLSLTLLHLTPRPVFLLNGLHQVTLLSAEKNFKTTEALQRNSLGNTPSSSLENLSDSDASLTYAPTTRTTNTFSSQPNSIKSGELSPLPTNTTIKLSETKNSPGSDVIDHSIASSNLSSKTDLSTTGQLINKLLQETSHTAQKLSITGNTPLLPELLAKTTNTLATPQLASQLETQLRQNISNSGLFYESHVAAWLSGKKTKEELQDEPQAQIALNLEESILTDSDNRQHANLAQIIHQQLDVLEHQKLNWTGLLATGIPMQWSIEESPPDPHLPHHEHPSDDQRWHSYLRIELPNLGVVAVHVNLNAGQLQLNVQSESPTSIHVLKSQYDALKDAIENTGTHIQAFTVQHHEQL